MSHLGMGGDVWMRRLGPVTPKGAEWMHFNNASAALRYLQFPDGGPLTKLAHTQVMRAAKTDGTRDGWAFTMKNPASSSGASAALPPPWSCATPSLSPFLLVPVRCACCGAIFCGTKHSCQRCHKVVDEACMTMVGVTVHCFSCTSRTCGPEVYTLDVECHKCHFHVHPKCTTYCICTPCIKRCRPSNPAPSPKKLQFKREWLITCSWLRYDATRDKMWCIACQQYPQLGHFVPLVQGTSRFMLCYLKYHQRSGAVERK